MLVAVSLLTISLSILLYRHPPSSWRTWLSSGTESVCGKQPGNLSLDDSTEQRNPIEAQQAERRVQVNGESKRGSRTPENEQTTPKATANDAQDGVAVPAFSLTMHEISDDDEEDMPPPSFPALNSAQRAFNPAPKPSLTATPAIPTAMAPPPRPAAPSLMPPPSIKPSNLRALPTISTPQSLRAPATGPLPNRGPIPNRNSNGSINPRPSSSLTVKTPNARNKSSLAPGHSPLDWANLQRSGKNLSGVSSLIRVSPSMLKYNNGRKGKPAWSTYQGKVYNITPYLPFHPGGEGELRRAAGKDGGKLFMEVHPWVNWENMLGECVVGIMVSEEQVQADSGGSNLDDMD